MKKTAWLSLLILTLTSITPLTHASFKDVSEAHPFFNSISYLEEKGVLEGYTSGDYLPEAEINRVETLKIILLGSRVAVPEVDIKEVFPDVLGGSWYAKYVQKAKDLGVVKGDDDTGLFRPGDPVQLDEIMKMIIETKGITPPSPSQAPFADVSAEAWSAPYFSYAKSLGMFAEVGDGQVWPGQKVTRGLMAELMYQLDVRTNGYEEGVASYYGLKVQGSGTASGETFDAYSLTAAHPSLPFGTMVLVTNLDNGKQVTVRINDRGPYSEGRIIDLSRVAFETIAPLSQGVAKVSIVPLNADGSISQSPPDCSEVAKMTEFPKDAFENINLDQGLRNRYAANEVLNLTGTSLSENKTVTAFVIDEKGHQFAYYGKKDANGHFSIRAFFPHLGNYKVGLLAGSSGSAEAYQVYAMDAECVSNQIDENLPPLANLNFSLKQGDLYLNWEDPQNYAVSKVTFLQGDKKQEYVVYGKDELVPHYADFQNWDEGFVTVEVRGAQTGANSVLKASDLKWGKLISAKFMATEHHDYQWNEDGLNPLQLNETLRVGSLYELKIDPLVPVRESALIILPNGETETHSLNSADAESIENEQGITVFPASAKTLSMGFTPQSNQTHFIEINSEGGVAVLNIPLYPENLYPLLPNPAELNPVDEDILEGGVSAARDKMLSLINQDRSDYKIPSVTLNDDLNQLAQARAEDMVERQYLSHWTPEGLNANDLRKNYGILPFVSENIARDSGLELAEYGLMRSALHRQNILDKEWKRAGVGIAKDPQGGGYLFVQIFSDDPIDFAKLEDLRGRVLAAYNDGRTSDIFLDNGLNTVAQGWSEKMVNEDFFSFTAPGGQTLVDAMRDAGVEGLLGTYIVGNSSFEAALDKIRANPQLKESRWKSLGVGIKQDKYGIIKFTLTYKE